MGFYRSQSATRPLPSTSDRTPVPSEVLDAIRKFDTCTVANAIEQFKIRLRNEGFTRAGLHCVTGGFPRLLGYAATCTVRAADPPMAGDSYAGRTDWWAEIGNLPLPRVAVIQDLDAAALGASTVGEVHAAILKAFHCDGLITNGAVRDLPGVSRMRFPMFASSAAVSHAYAHMVDYGKPVEIFGLTIHSGDLLYADCHGVLSIPLDIAPQIPEVAAAIRAQEQEIIALCQSPEFSREKLLKAVHNKK